MLDIIVFPLHVALEQSVSDLALAFPVVFSFYYHIAAKRPNLVFIAWPCKMEEQEDMRYSEFDQVHGSLLIQSHQRW